MSMSPRLLRPRQTGFDPRSISGLLLWLDGSDSSTIGNLSTGVGGASNNGPVRFWADKSGNGRNALNSGSLANTPTFNSSGLNGKSFIGFDGGDSIGGAWGSGLAIPRQTTFLVMRYDSAVASSFARVFTQNATSVQTGSGTGESGGYVPVIRNGSTGTFGGFRGGVRAGVTLTSGQWCVFESAFRGTSCACRSGLTAYTTEAISDYAATFDTYSIGNISVGGGAPFGNAIAECLVYNSAMSQGNADAVMKYLLKKYAI